MVQGLSIGIFMGVLAGLIMLLLLNPAILITRGKPTKAIVKLVLQITTALLTLPAILFGGSWLSNSALHLEGLSNFSECYTLSLTIVFLIMVAFPLARWILKFGRNIGESL